MQSDVHYHHPPNLNDWIWGLGSDHGCGCFQRDRTLVVHRMHQCLSCTLIFSILLEHILENLEDG